MSDYTLTTDDLRDYIRSTSKRRGADGTQEMVAEFDRWLAQTIQEAKAEALHDAADKLDAGYHPTQTGTLDWHGEVGFYGEADWLRALADDLLKGQDQ